jgi:hypothetical protein
MLPHYYGLIHCLSTFAPQDECSPVVLNRLFAGGRGFGGPPDAGLNTQNGSAAIVAAGNFLHCLPGLGNLV